MAREAVPSTQDPVPQSFTQMLLPAPLHLQESTFRACLQDKPRATRQPHHADSLFLSWSDRGGTIKTVGEGFPSPFFPLPPSGHSSLQLISTHR